ncbi:MAG: ATP-binding protein [Vicinamibacterales bacterium]
MAPPGRRRDSRLTHEQRVVLLATGALAPGVLTALWLLWSGDFTPRFRWTFALIVVGGALGFLTALRTRVVVPLQTVSNLLAALREGDFSIRARGARLPDALGDVMREINALAETLREERLEALEATALLRKVMAEIDVAVFTFDDERRLQLLNRFGERLLGQPAERMLGKSATGIGLGECFDFAGTVPDPPGPRIKALSFPGGSGRWEVRHSTFRQHGKPHQLLVMADVSKPLREEERRAWQRLIRVLGHELNNSLAPIKSIAGSLRTGSARPVKAADWDDDLRRGLEIIESRAEALARFMGAYARLARLPAPTFRELNLADMVRRVVALETRVPVRIDEGPTLVVRGDGDQLEQALINLVRNAVDAARETDGAVRVSWLVHPGRAPQAEIVVEDEGPGLLNTANLFVPFFTTKPSGTGIGLVISRQIAEAHGGTLTLENRSDRTGCRARLQLPA